MLFRSTDDVGSIDAESFATGDRLLDTLELPITPTQPGADATPPVGTATPTAIAPAATTPAAAKQQRNNTTRKAATRRSRR